MFIKNVTGSSKVSAIPPYPCTSWLNYWERNTGFSIQNGKLYNCPACGKSVYRNDFDGCHVKKAYNTFDNKWYIVPLCSSCNQSNTILNIDNNVPMVPTPSNLR